MKLTKLEHSGIILEKDGQKLVFDPVEFVNQLPELQNVAAVIITHKHFNHLQMDALQKIMATNPEAKIVGPEDLTVEFPQFITAKNGDELEINGFRLHFSGHDHGLVFGGVMPCQNLGVIVDGCVMNPGDSFDQPAVENADVLLVPEVAPWWNVADCTKFITEIKPKIAIPVHDALLSPFGKQVFDGGLKATCEKVGANWVPLKPGDSLEI